MLHLRFELKTQSLNAKNKRVWFRSLGSLDLARPTTWDQWAVWAARLTAHPVSSGSISGMRIGD